jgi:glycosyltransferase involved in cell wall biosynthesis
VRKQDISSTATAGARIAPPARKPVVLVCVRYYLPGFRSGGPVRSVSNLIDRLGDEYDFKVVCLDRDFGGNTRYERAAPHDWIVCGKARVRYLAPGEAGFVKWRALADETGADIVYLNSLFDPAFSLVPLLALAWDRRYRIVLAPRGELSPGALSLKAFRKKVFLAIFRLLRVHSRIRWHASSELEAQDIRREFPSARRLVGVAANLPGVTKPVYRRNGPKIAGTLKAVFLSRIAPKKNLMSAIRSMCSLVGPATLDIWGPIDDRDYWQACQAAMASRPENVHITWRGDVPNEDVHRILSEYDLFLLPTLGENFGHAIVEALGAGLPIVISDRTPWKKLREAGVGVDLPVDDDAAFVEALREFQAMSETSLAAVRDRCRAYVESWSNESADLNPYRTLLKAGAWE